MLASMGLAAVLGASGLRPSTEPVPIVGGEEVVGDDWRSTVLVDLGLDLCTGTLISERVVLTAAHCLRSSPPAELLRVVLGNRGDQPQAVLPVASYALHPEACTDLTECDEDLHDFAYLELAEPAPADAVAPRLPTDQGTWDAATASGVPITLVGFGDDDQQMRGVKRAVEVRIRGFTDSGLELRAGGDGKDSCQGDSGGPAFARLPDGQEVLVGVLSRGGACGEGGYYGSAPTALCWVGEALGIAWDPADADCGGCGCIDLDPRRHEDEGCSIAGDRGGTGGALALLGLLAAMRRRRRTDGGA